ncbi:unnamed protein product, partial [Nippostrongylus brasiliensis]|uniref:Ku domain-containing protein n=1 Tax=Nippostrongylus brasiliensis TaxID=27835 RepID=A0A0N4XJ94_NIPBR
INPPPSDEANITEATRRVYKKYSPSTEDRLGADDIKFLNAHTHLVQHDFVDTDTDPEGTQILVPMVAYAQSRIAKSTVNVRKALQEKTAQIGTCASTMRVRIIRHAETVPKALTYVIVWRTPSEHIVNSDVLLTSAPAMESALCDLMAKLAANARMA